MKYSNQLPNIIMPVYGRHIQDMIAFCKTITAREERNAYANRVVKIMQNLVPEIGSGMPNDEIYWNHLAVISQFQLDIDYPYGVISKEDLQRAPEQVPYPRTTQHGFNMHYGKLTQLLIETCIKLPEGPERENIEILIANQMKRSLTAWSQDVVTDKKIVSDLLLISNGKIDLTNKDIILEDSSAIIDTSAKKKKKKKK